MYMYIYMYIYTFSCTDAIASSQVVYSGYGQPDIERVRVHVYTCLYGSCEIYMYMMADDMCDPLPIVVAFHHPLRIYEHNALKSILLHLRALKFEP